MAPEDRVRLQHMVDAARSAQRFLSGRQRADLDGDEMLRFAVVRAIEIIGEAASRVSHAARAELPAVPWPAVIGMRNRMVHAYFDIDHDVVWRTVQVELPALLSWLEPTLHYPD
jgi:uncharacterized protein with HEPN domain